MISAFCGVSPYCIWSAGVGKTLSPPLSARLKQQNGHLTQVEVNEMLRLMSHVTAKVPPNDAVPGWVILLVKLLGGTKNRKIFFFFKKCTNVKRVRQCLQILYKTRWWSKVLFFPPSQTGEDFLHWLHCSKNYLTISWTIFSDYS